MLFWWLTFWAGQLQADIVSGQLVNLALGKPVVAIDWQNNRGPPSRLTDGMYGVTSNLEEHLVSTGEYADPWVCVDLERYYLVSSVGIYNRESPWHSRMDNFHTGFLTKCPQGGNTTSVGDHLNLDDYYQPCGNFSTPVNPASWATVTCSDTVFARYVVVQSAPYTDTASKYTTRVNIHEIQVLGTEAAQFQTPEVREKSCSQPDESERTKTVDINETTCFILPVGSCDTCFDEYKIMFPFNLNSTALGGNLQNIGIQMSDIPCKQIEVLTVLLEENDNFLYHRCSTSDIAADFCEAMCEKGFSGKNKLLIKLSNFTNLESTSQLCEVIFV